MKLFKSSGFGQHYAAILAVLVLLTFATSTFAGVLSTEIENFKDALVDQQIDILKALILLSSEYDHM